MAEKRQLENPKKEDQPKSVLLSLLRKVSPSITEEEDTSKNKSLLYSIWRNMTGGKKEEEHNTQEQETDTQQQQEKQEPEVELFLEGNPLLELRRAWKQELNASAQDLPTEQEQWGPQDLLPDGELTSVHRKLIKAATQTAKEMLKEFQGSNTEQLKAVNSKVNFLVSDDELTVYMMALPPLYGGKEIAESQLRTVLAENNISFGIEGHALEKLAEPIYFQILEVAHGQPAVNGADGRIEEVVPTSSSVRFVEKENGIIDFKDMNWFHNVCDGDVLCNLIPPTAPQNGTNVHGVPIVAKEGRKVNAPVGKNTAVSEDGLTVIATMDGQVSFQSGKYKIEQALTINGDVDYSTGNLDVKGNVVIKGDVRDGFVVRASGDITVYGMIEGATLKAGGSIFANTGMNGNARGNMTAGGDIKCKFIENGFADAKGDIYLESAINANLSSQGSILIKSGRGVLVGGEIVAMKTIEAITVGNKNHRATTVSIVPTERFREKQRKMEAELKETQEELATLPVEQKGKPVPNEVRLRSTALKMRERQLRQKLKEMDEQREEIDLAVMRFGVLYPNTNVTIGTATTTSQQQHNQCLIYNKGGEIVFGTK
ncbi:MAG: DUF342 domain-containing protein [Anaerotruncus sp.]|nr:DUF342 domain-containing protein [Anaerotruncus sp.]